MDKFIDNTHDNKICEKNLPNFWPTTLSTIVNYRSYDNLYDKLKLKKIKLKSPKLFNYGNIKTTNSTNLLFYLFNLYDDRKNKLKRRKINSLDKYLNLKRMRLEISAYKFHEDVFGDCDSETSLMSMFNKFCYKSLICEFRNVYCLKFCTTYLGILKLMEQLTWKVDYTIFKKINKAFNDITQLNFTIQIFTNVDRTFMNKVSEIEKIFFPHQKNYNKLYYYRIHIIILDRGCKPKLYSVNIPLIKQQFKNSHSFQNFTNDDDFSKFLLQSDYNKYFVSHAIRLLLIRYSNISNSCYLNNCERIVQLCSNDNPYSSFLEEDVLEYSYIEDNELVHLQDLNSKDDLEMSKISKNSSYYRNYIKKFISYINR